MDLVLSPVHAEGLGKYIHIWEHTISFLNYFKNLVSFWKYCVCIYIYIYICRCVYLGSIFFINAYFIEQYRHLLSTHFCICPFQLPYRFYGIRQELVDETPITNCYLVLSAQFWAIIRGLYIAKAMWLLHVHYFFVSVYYLFWCVIVVFDSFL